MPDVGMIGRLTGARFVGRSIGRSVARSVARSVGTLVSWLVACLADCAWLAVESACFTAYFVSSLLPRSPKSPSKLTLSASSPVCWCFLRSSPSAL